MNDFILFSGSSNIPLAQSVAKQLQVPLGAVDLSRFADGEQRPWIQEDVRDKTIFVLESLSCPMDEHIMEITLMGDAIRRSAPKTMIAVIPYMGYSRQDKQHRAGEPISARVIAKFLEVSKFREVITIDLHNDAIVGFFQIPVMHISALPVLTKEVKKLNLNNPVVVSPDVGGVKRARNLAYQLDIPMVVMEKKRDIDKHDLTTSYQILGDVCGKSAVIIDDIISTGGTIAHGAISLKEAGVQSITICATHAVLAGSAIQTLAKTPVDNIIITDTISVPREKLSKQFTVVSVASTIANAIATIRC